MATYVLKNVWITVYGEDSRESAIETVCIAFDDIADMEIRIDREQVEQVKYKTIREV